MNDTEKPVRIYSAERDHIKNGDVLLYKGKSSMSRIIRMVTRSPYSHAGIAVWWNERLMVMEAVGKGVVVTPLSKNVSHYDGGVEWYQHREPINENLRVELVRFAQQQLGKEYALWKVILLGLYRIFLLDTDKRDRLSRETRLFCSQYVAQAYNAIDKDLRKNVNDRFMSPGDIAKSGALKIMGILKNEESKHANPQKSSKPQGEYISITKINKPRAKPKPVQKKRTLKK